METNWTLTELARGGLTLPPLYAEIEDPRLVESVQNGDGAAISRALDLCLPSVRHVAVTRFGLSGEDVEDVLQEVRVAFWQSATRFRGESSLRTFVTQIASRKCIDHLRRQQHHSSEPLTQDDVPDPTANPFDRSTERLAIEDVIRELSPRQHQVLRLYYIHGKRYREIADELGITVGTVASIKAEALVRVRSLTSDETPRQSP